MSFRRSYDLNPSSRGSDWFSNRYDRMLDLQAYTELPRHVDRYSTVNRKSYRYGDDVKQGAGLKVRYGREDGWDASRSGGTITNGYSYHRYGDEKPAAHLASIFNGSVVGERRPSVYRSPSNVAGVSSGGRYYQDNNNSSQVARSLDYSLRRSTTNNRQNANSHNKQQHQLTKKVESVNSEVYYLQKLKQIIYDNKTPLPKGSPAKILDYLYLGSYWNAKHVVSLHKLGITHVLNCAAPLSTDQSNPYHRETGIKHYMSILAQDVESYDMLQHVERANAFINDARRKGGKVLVHCVMGINRSGFIVAAYLIGALKVPLVTAVRLLKERRGTVLYNVGFQKQLVAYARKKGLL